MGNIKFNLSKDLHYWITLNGELREIDARKFLQSQPSLEEILIGFDTKPKNSKSLLLTHYPPYQSGLDECMNGPIGSKTISDFIEKSSFDAVCSGHAHESPYLTHKWMHRIGNTICMNPGQLGGENLNAIVFDTDDIEGTLIHTVFGRPDDEVNYVMTKEELRGKLAIMPNTDEYESKKNRKSFLQRFPRLLKRRI